MRERGRSPSPELPPALAAFLRGVDLAAVTTETNLGTVLVVKAPSDTIADLTGEVPIGIDHELYNRPSAPVIRMITTFHDRPDTPLVFETFFNVADHQQRREYENLSGQEELPIILYDADLSSRLGKRVRIPNGEEIAGVLRAADDLRAAIDPSAYDFDRAKREVIAAIPFPEIPYR
jgi:hypothetical protein